MKAVKAAQLVWLKIKSCEPAALCSIALSSFANNLRLESNYESERTNHQQTASDPTRSPSTLSNQLELRARQTQLST